MTFWVVERRVFFSLTDQFQSLFYWNDLLSLGGERIGEGVCSFNPCSIGMTFWVIFPLLGHPNVEWFQSLFYWNDLLSRDGSDLSRDAYSVSILVLLEWPSEWMTMLQDNAARLSFQSLFYWNDLLSCRRVRSSVGLARFQSLFYWNDLLSRGSSRPLAQHLTQVSILVLLEWPSELKVRVVDHTRHNEFQSLFYWNDLLSSSSLSVCSLCTSKVFQSLFYWNDLLSFLSRVLLGILLVLVSILVLLEWPSE